MDPRPYLGSKTRDGIWKAIVAAMPPHDTYIELFAGTCAVMRAKPRAARELAVEIDRQTLADFPPPGHAEIFRLDALAFLRSFDFAAAGRVLIYADPPYLLSTRTSAHRYRHELSEAKHRELLDLLRCLPPNVAVILSGYPSGLYDARLQGWRKVELQTMTRGGPRTECLWMNFDITAVHWASWAGENFTRRQNIKRKAARWAGHYRSLAPGERLAVLAALLAVEAEPCNTTLPSSD